MRHRLSSGKYIKIRENILMGLYEYDTLELSVDIRTGEKEKLDTFIHELLHAEFPNWSEKEVRKRSNSISSLLWKVGYRRVKRKKRAKSPG